MSEFAKFAAALRRSAQSLEPRAEQLVGEVGEEVLRDARARVRKDTGRLAGSLHIERQGARVEVVTSESYAGFQEFGTSLMAPQPFIGPAARTGGDRLVEGLEHLVDEIGMGL